MSTQWSEITQDLPRHSWLWPPPLAIRPSSRQPLPIVEAADSTPECHATIGLHIRIRSTASTPKFYFRDDNCLTKEINRWLSTDKMSERGHRGRQGARGAVRIRSSPPDRMGSQTPPLHRRLLGPGGSQKSYGMPLSTAARWNWRRWAVDEMQRMSESLTSTVPSLIRQS